ncbi:hypothetical protein AB9G26_09515 [Francisella philomiragia]|uniref:hypothetical protein n=1 Tax=Francisella philomiragia TaxID=28110 RepID=UPI003517F309
MKSEGKNKIAKVFEAEFIVKPQGSLLEATIPKIVDMAREINWIFKNENDRKIFKYRMEQISIVVDKNNNSVVGILACHDGMKPLIYVTFLDCIKLFGLIKGVSKYLLYYSSFLLLFSSFNKLYVCRQWVRKDYRNKRVVGKQGIYSLTWYFMIEEALREKASKVYFADISLKKPLIEKLLIRRVGFKINKYSLRRYVLFRLGYSRIESIRKDDKRAG